MPRLEVKGGSVVLDVLIWQGWGTHENIMIQPLIFLKPLQHKSIQFLSFALCRKLGAKVAMELLLQTASKACSARPSSPLVLTAKKRARLQTMGKPTAILFSRSDI
jgi:hypothetical protein